MIELPNHLLPWATVKKLLKQAKRDAWDEGYETGCSSQYGTATPSGKSYDPDPNPYQEDE